MTFNIDSKHGNFIILIDDEDFERISKHSWSISKNGKYIRVETRIKSKLIRLHRFILNLKPGDPEVDHRDRNPLNNQKNNLRVCSREENMRNIKFSTIENKTGYIGVYRNHGNGKYRACCSINNKTYHISGNFDTAEEAAKARDKYVLTISGEFTVLNFPKKKAR